MNHHLNDTLARVTENIVERSKVSRSLYLKRTKSRISKKPRRENLGCTNLAHAIAAEADTTKLVLKELKQPNVGIVSAYNDVLSAHQPYYRYPELLKEAVEATGATAQVACGVPAMCDGVTQGQIGMEMSLFSRDVIALATAIGLTHDVFDSVCLLGICDKIVPGLLMGALAFGQIPAIFIPSGPMVSGIISNQEKAKVRVAYAEGKVGRDKLLESEMKSYSSKGTCTFYGTANSNQVLLEMMGLQLPGSSFVAPDTDLRKALSRYAAKVACFMALHPETYALCNFITEKSLVNAMVGLLATGGSTNHTIHLIAIAKIAGISLNWDDFEQISKVTPLLASLYPNGQADVNDFHHNGGVPFIVKELLKKNLLHEDILSVSGKPFAQFHTKIPSLNENGEVQYLDLSDEVDHNVVRPAVNPFSPHGGLILLQGNLGRAIAKTSAIDPKNYYVKAEAAVFRSQEEVVKAYKADQLNRDCMIVVTHQGPKANGMPELHSLTPLMVSLQHKGYSVGLVTDGRMSGASGKVPHALHLTPDSTDGGLLAKIKNGDMMELDLAKGTLRLLVPEHELKLRQSANVDLTINQEGLGRELFAAFRRNASSSEMGAIALL